MEDGQKSWLQPYLKQLFGNNTLKYHIERTRKQLQMNTNTLKLYQIIRYSIQSSFSTIKAMPMCV